MHVRTRQEPTAQTPFHTVPLTLSFAFDDLSTKQTSSPLPHQLLLSINLSYLHLHLHLRLHLLHTLNATPMDGLDHAIMAAVISLGATPPPMLIRSLSLQSNLHFHRLYLLAKSSHHFNCAVRRLESLSLNQKTQLIATIFVDLLRTLTHFLQTSKPQRPSLSISDIADLDAGTLLLVLCEVHEQELRGSDSSHRKMKPQAEWPQVLAGIIAGKVLSMTGIGVGGSSSFASLVMRYGRLLEAMQGLLSAGGVGPTFDDDTCEGSGTCEKGECVICTEELGVGACRLPCSHVFHRQCIGMWLKGRSTCPCCRLELGGWDVYREIDRQVGVLLGFVNGRTRSSFASCDGEM
ncbi:E3 ubiquitin-protein ligase SGR9, amyloplastic [Amborella trichopoda]|uniref:RING-type domain-containing protein n=1 Tax=Amborella trichopoda TaxID=13333 RepID=W1NJT1_AMBTC|nr:E3 ubiquitin-protein ligase SGR9, amyloplastic [Amborella trichopoda]ERM95691.1 hypothetical protein AMTR_s00023p00219040 [Amborella trichopoda]|eukprot:XP_006828275.3 E3 ubiquitin-protein ligase SGR9, amyloplastic [Amborella trichopoda]